MAQSKDRAAETTYSGVPPAEPSRPQLESAAATFALLSNPARLHVLWLAAQDVHDVTALAERAGVAQERACHRTEDRAAGPAAAALAAGPSPPLAR